jgi:hypothetical protein
VLLEYSTRLWRCGAAAGIQLAAVLAVGLPGTATAAEPGVHIDPGSPAGKEYALPIEQARRDAVPPGGGPGGGGGGGGAGGGSSGPGGSPLFGAGILAQASSSAARDGAAARSSGGAGKGATARRASGPALPAPASTGAAADTNQTLLLAIAVLAAGGLSGLAVRRFRRPRA